MPEQNSIDFLLWADNDIFQSSYEKSAHALIAIQRCLSNNSLPNNVQDEFLQHYEFLAEADSQHFYQVWSNPFAQQWVKLAYRLCQAHFANVPLDTETQTKYHLDPVNALCRHLGEFRQLVLAIALLEQKDFQFKSTLSVSLPFIIPASKVYFAGQGELHINGLCQQKLLISSPHQSQNELPIENTLASPCAKIEDYQLILHAAAFNNLPALDFAEAVLNSSLNDITACVEVVEKSLAIIQQYAPRIFQQFKQVIHFVGLKSMQESYYSNISHSELPGCFIASMNWNAYILADIFIHEFSHNRLFFIESAQGQLFSSNTDALSDCDFYSPWREDIRPIYGVLHAVYVYIPVYHYWQALYADNSLDAEFKSFISNEIVKIALQLYIGVYQLTHHGQFTEFGSTLFAQLSCEVNEIISSVKQQFSLDIAAYSYNEGGDFIAIKDKETALPLSVKGVIIKHIERFAPPEQAQQINRHMAITEIY